MRLHYDRFHWIAIGFFSLLTSCLSTGKISVQVAVPPKLTVPNEIQSLVLMNRSMTSEFSDYNADSLEALLIGKKLALDDIFLDSIAADTTLKVLGNTLFQSGRFDVVIPLKRNITNVNSSFKDPSPSLTLKQVKQLCTEFDSDALLMLENFSEKVNTVFKLNAGSMYTDAGLVNMSTAFVQVVYHSNWKLYQPQDQLKMAKFEVQDTIFWERSGASLQETYEKLPMIKEALIGGGIENAKSLAEYISPGWKEEVRSYFITKNDGADNAISYLRKNDWKEAENTWKKYSSSTSASFRSKIEFNLALAAEMNGKPEEAIEWAKKSLKSSYSKMAENYITILNMHLANN
jgi:hypothetical protein